MTVYLISTAAGGVGKGGGGQTFARHMLAAFKSIGVDAALLQLSKRKEGEVAIGDRLGTVVTNVTAATMLATVRHGASIIVTPDYGKYLPEESKDLQTKLMRLGTRMIIHDPKPFDKRNVHEDDFAAAGLGCKLPTRPIFIRPSMKKFWPDGIFIPHPFVPWETATLKTKTACSLGRIESAKRSALIHEANLKLPAKARIDMWGKENRLYTFSKGMPQGCYDFPITQPSEQLLGAYKLMFDMSYFKDDGGGSQYTFMEAWNSGTVPVVHEDWLRFPGEMKAGHNCLTVGGVDDIRLLAQAAAKNAMGSRLVEIAANGHADLRKLHDPKKIARAYCKELGL